MQQFPRKTHSLRLGSDSAPGRGDSLCDRSIRMRNRNWFAESSSSLKNLVFFSYVKIADLGLKFFSHKTKKSSDLNFEHLGIIYSPGIFLIGEERRKDKRQRQTESAESSINICIMSAEAERRKNSSANCSFLSLFLERQKSISFLLLLSSSWNHQRGFLLFFLPSFFLPSVVCVPTSPA